MVHIGFRTVRGLESGFRYRHIQNKKMDDNFVWAGQSNRLDRFLYRCLSLAAIGSDNLYPNPAAFQDIRTLDLHRASDKSLNH